MSDVLSRLNTLDETSNGINDILSIIKERMGFEAVGIRLREGEDFPYHQTYGFPDSFVQMESILCARDETGRLSAIRRGIRCWNACAEIFSAGEPIPRFLSSRRKAVSGVMARPIC